MIQLFKEFFCWLRGHRFYDKDTELTIENVLACRSKCLRCGETFDDEYLELIPHKVWQEVIKFGNTKILSRIYVEEHEDIWDDERK